MRGLITLVNDNHVDNCLKEILAFVYYGSIVNSRIKKVELGQWCQDNTWMNAMPGI